MPGGIPVASVRSLPAVAERCQTRSALVWNMHPPVAKLTNLALEWNMRPPMMKITADPSFAVSDARRSRMKVKSSSPFPTHTSHSRAWELGSLLSDGRASWNTWEQKSQATLHAGLITRIKTQLCGRISRMSLAWRDYAQFCQKVLREEPGSAPEIRKVGLYIEYRLTARVTWRGSVLQNPLNPSTIAGRLSELQKMAESQGLPTNGYNVLRQALQKEKETAETMALPLSINDAWTAFLKIPKNMRLPFILA